MEDSAALRVSHQGRLGRIIISNPKRRNAGTVAMWRAFTPALADLVGDPEVRAILIEGDGGRDFMSGADIGEFNSRPIAEALKTVEEGALHAYREVWNCPKPVIAVIRGYCLGGGLALAACCDLRVACDDAKFGIPAIKLGVGYPADSIAKLRSLIGPAFTKEILLTGRFFTAQEALRIGLVNRVTTSEELESSATALAQSIAAGAPMTIRTVKLVDRDLDRPPAEQSPELWAREIAACFASADFAEGCKAFAEKRQPEFLGR